MAQGCHWPPHPSSSSLPLFSYLLTTSLQAGWGGARPALLGIISPGMGAQAGCSPARGISIRSAEPLTAACLLLSHTGLICPSQQLQRVGNAEPHAI